MAAVMLSSSIVPAKAPLPSTPDPPPRVTLMRPSLSGAKAGHVTQPPKGSVCGTPSSNKSARDEALPPRPLSVAPWLVALADRASLRRNCVRPAISFSASSIRLDAVPLMRSGSRVTMLKALSLVASGRAVPVTMISYSWACATTLPVIPAAARPIPQTASLSLSKGRLLLRKE